MKSLNTLPTLFLAFIFTIILVGVSIADNDITNLTIDKIDITSDGSIKAILRIEGTDVVRVVEKQFSDLTELEDYVKEALYSEDNLDAEMVEKIARLVGGVKVVVDTTDGNISVTATKPDGEEVIFEPVTQKTTKSGGNMSVLSTSFVVDGDKIEVHDDGDDISVKISIEDVGEMGETIRINIGSDGEIEREISIPISNLEIETE